MNNLPEENMEEKNGSNDLVKRLNVDAVASVLTKMSTDNYAITAEFVDLKRMISKVTQEIAELRSQLNVLKAMGGRGTIRGTGSTVHTSDE